VVGFGYMKNRFDGGFIAGGIFIQTLLIYLVMATIDDNNYSFLTGFHLMAVAMGFFLYFIVYSVNSYLREHKD
jgi:hypothetical protein